MWAHGKRHGEGTFRTSNGMCRDCEWHNDELKCWRSKEYFGTRKKK